MFQCHFTFPSDGVFLCAMLTNLATTLQAEFFKNFGSRNQNGEEPQPTALHSRAALPESCHSSFCWWDEPPGVQLPDLPKLLLSFSTSARSPGQKPPSQGVDLHPIQSTHQHPTPNIRFFPPTSRIHPSERPPHHPALSEPRRFARCVVDAGSPLERDVSLALHDRRLAQRQCHLQSRA